MKAHWAHISTKFTYNCPVCHDFLFVRPRGNVANFITCQKAGGNSSVELLLMIAQSRSRSWARSTDNLSRYSSYRKAPPFPLRPGQLRPSPSDLGSYALPPQTWAVTSTCLELPHMKCCPRYHSTVRDSQTTPKEKFNTGQKERFYSTCNCCRQQTIRSKQLLLRNIYIPTASL
jgi:hypothetical protein